MLLRCCLACACDAALLAPAMRADLTSSFFLFFFFFFFFFIYFFFAAVSFCTLWLRGALWMCRSC